MRENFEILKGPGDQTLADDKKIMEALEKRLARANTEGDEAEIRRYQTLIRGRRIEAEKSNPTEN